MSITGSSYTEEFRRDAVELLRSNGKPIKQVARELGVNVNSLRTWRNRSLFGQSGSKGVGAVWVVAGREIVVNHLGKIP